MMFREVTWKIKPKKVQRNLRKIKNLGKINNKLEKIKEKSEGKLKKI